MAYSETFTRPRNSTETDRRHLLANSVTPSASVSVVDYPIESNDDEGSRTPRPSSPQRSYDAMSQNRSTVSTTQSQQRGDDAVLVDTAPKPYKGFPSEEAYLEALREWAETKKYVNYDTSLVGFYGQTSMQELASRPKMELGLKRKMRERKARKREMSNSVS